MVVGVPAVLVLFRRAPEKSIQGAQAVAASTRRQRLERTSSDESATVNPITRRGSTRAGHGSGGACHVAGPAPMSLGALFFVASENRGALSIEWPPNGTTGSSASPLPTTERRRSSGAVSAGVRERAHEGLRPACGFGPDVVGGGEICLPDRPPDDGGLWKLGGRDCHSVRRDAPVA